MTDILIVGGGPAGLTAAIYGLRANKSVTVVEKDAFGGQITHSPKVENIPGFSEIMTASNFGQLSDLATREDIALGIINMVFETIGMVSIFAARNYGLRDVVLTGNLSGMETARSVFDGLNKLFDMNFTIPEYSRFGTVIGAALAEQD